MKTILALLCALTASLAAHGQVLIPNGSFETGMTGWLITGSVEALGPPRTSMPVGTDGTRAAAIGTFDNAGASMSQVLHLTADQTYSMTFDLLASGVGVGGLTGKVQVALFSGATIYASPLFTAVSPPTVHNGAEGFSPQQFFFSLPTGINDVTLKFTDVSSNGGAGVDLIVDNIRIAAVPEPQTCVLALMGLAFGWSRLKMLRH
jgi:hypothetical protein